ncbi:uncharacterized protein LOC128883871 isoform X2 [Hylaeus volcanicus]|uniref:uncharacterized protein LOC128883871 isoform X2 n=1 Tax=Hylaeus volcanicus TaxID=313075 RepID=UPI0023B7ACF5|nr:uncharacterized protein LOC128883871 isoform X2 [Hylaeus volcanicus]
MAADTSSNTSSNDFLVNDNGDFLNTQNTQEDIHSFHPKLSNTAIQSTQSQLFQTPYFTNRNIAYHSRVPPSPRDHSPHSEQGNEPKQWEDENRRYKLEIHKTESQQSVNGLLPIKFNQNIHSEQPQSHSSININQSLSRSASPLAKPYPGNAKDMDQLEGKLVQQNKEIQQLLEQRIVLETELAAFRGSKNVSSDAMLHTMVNSPSPHHRKFTQIEHASEDQPLGCITRDEPSGVPEDKTINPDLKKKKKSGQKWFSFTRYKKDSKKSNENNTELILDDLSKPASSDNVPLIKNENSLQAKKIEQTDPEAFDVDTSMITSLQRNLAYVTNSNALLQSEIQALKLELQTQFTQHFLIFVKELIQSCLGETNKILLPIPFDKEKTPDQLQLLFEVQARALEKLSLKNTMLQNRLVHEQNTRTSKILENDKPDQNLLNKCTTENEKPLESGLRETYQETLASLLREKNTVALLEEKVRKLQTLLKEEKQRFTVSVEALKSEINKYKVLSGNLVRKCETTQNELCKERVHHLEETKQYEEKLRCLKNAYSRASPVKSLIDLSLTKTNEHFMDAPHNHVYSGSDDGTGSIKKRFKLAKEKVVNISFLRHDFSSAVSNPLNIGCCTKSQSPVFIEREENGYYLCETLPSRLRPTLKAIASPALIKWATTSNPVVPTSSVPLVSSSNSNNYKKSDTEYRTTEDQQKTTVTPVLSDYRHLMSHSPTGSVPSHTTQKNCLQLPYTLTNFSVNPLTQPYLNTTLQTNKSSLQNIANMSSSIDPRNVLPLK